MEDSYELVSTEAQLVAQRFLNQLKTDEIKPFSEDIFLMHTFVAGTNHVEGIEELARNLAEGDELILRREPENPYDPLAILVLNQQEQKLGYIPKAKNEVVARLMDAGKRMYAKVSRVSIEGNIEFWTHISLDVFLKDL